MTTLITVAAIASVLIVLVLFSIQPTLSDLHTAGRAHADRHRRQLGGDPALDEAGDASGGGARFWIGRVTARYGSLVTVTDVEGDVDSPQSRAGGHGTQKFVYAGKGHGWLPNVDLLIIAPAPPGLTTKDDGGGGVSIRWLAIGTMNEFDADTFGGIAASCVFDPSEPLAGCMFGITDDPVPPAA